MTDGSYQLIEVKGDNMIDDPVVKAKQIAAEEMAISVCKNSFRGQGKDVGDVFGTSESCCFTNEVNGCRCSRAMAFFS